MFGMLLSGRLVDTNFRTVDASHVTIDVPDVDRANHVVVFLTGTQAFPEDMGGAVYLALNNADWRFLGGLTNAKPSAIFKIARLKNKTEENVDKDLVARFGGSSLNDDANGNKAQLGISMEPLAQLSCMMQSAAEDASASTIPAFVEFSQKMVENLFNYTSSFAVPAHELMRRPNETFVPFSSLQTWYTNFERRLQANPYFWRN